MMCVLLKLLFTLAVNPPFLDRPISSSWFMMILYPIISPSHPADVSVHWVLVTYPIISQQYPHTHVSIYIYIIYIRMLSQWHHFGVVWSWTSVTCTSTSTAPQHHDSQVVTNGPPIWDCWSTSRPFHSSLICCRVCFLLENQSTLW